MSEETSKLYISADKSPSNAPLQKAAKQRSTVSGKRLVNLWLPAKPRDMLFYGWYFHCHPIPDGHPALDAGSKSKTLCSSEALLIRAHPFHPCAQFSFFCQFPRSPAYTGYMYPSIRTIPSHSQPFQSTAHPFQKLSAPLFLRFFFVPSSFRGTFERTNNEQNTTEMHSKQVSKDTPPHPQPHPSKATQIVLFREILKSNL